MRLRALVLTLLFFTVLALTAQSVPLRFQGNVSEEKVRLSGVSLQISKSGRIINNIITDAHGNYAFELPMGGDYMVTVSKEGYVSKKFSVSTMGVPAEQASLRFPSIEVSLNLFKRVEGVDYSLLNQPVNKYYYNIDREDFDFDDNHLKQMLKGIEAIKEQERLIREKEKEREAQYTAAIRTGDKAFSKKEWPAATASYQEAIGIKSTESYPRQQLDNITKAIADEKAKLKSQEDAARLAREKRISDSLQKLESDRNAKAAAAAAIAAKALEDKKAREKAEAELAAKKQAEADAKKQQSEKELAAKQAKEKSDEEARLKKQAEDASAKQAALDAEKAAAAALLLKSKQESDAQAKKQAEEAAAKAKKDKENAELQLKDKAARAKADSLALAKKQSDEAIAKAKAEKEIAEKSQRDKAAKAKSDSLALAKKLADDAAAKKAAEEAALKANAQKTVLPVLGAADINYKQAINKADAAFSMRRYLDAKTAYEEALVAKSGDVYAKMRLLECERIINADANQKVNERQKLLLAKYPPGVTEEVIPGDGVVVIRRILVKDNVAFVFEKKVFNWGGIACFRDGETITELTFEQETKKEK